MIYFTKKLLFIWVFSIVCNFTTSDTSIDECKASVHEVFFEGMNPGYYLRHAMFALSEDLIKSMGGIQAYWTYYKKNTEAVRLINNKFFDKKHHETNIYFDLVFKNNGHKIPEETGNIPEETNNIPEETDNIPEETNNIPEETKKKHILGYFKALASTLKANTNGLINSYAISPDKLCTERYKNVTEHCREALYKMFGFEEKKKKQNLMRLSGMKGHDAFIYCYEKLNYLDLTIPKFFPKSKNEFSSDDFLGNQMKLGMMANYLSILTDAASQIVKENMKATISLFPTIDEYCSGASSSST